MVLREVIRDVLMFEPANTNLVRVIQAKMYHEERSVECTLQ